MKRYLIGLIIVLMLGLALHGVEAQIVNNGGGSGGGGGGSVTTGAGLTGNGTPQSPLTTSGVPTNMVNIVTDDGAAANQRWATDGEVANLALYGDSTSPSSPAVTTTSNNDVVLTVQLFYYTSSYTAPSTPTQRILENGNSCCDYMWAGEQTKATAGSVAAQTGTLSGSNYWEGWTLPLKPANASSAPTFVAAAGGQQTSGTTLTINVPTGTANGNVMIMCQGVNVPYTFTPNSAWTPLDRWATYGISKSGQCWYRVANSEPSSYSWTVSNSSGGAAGIILTYSGVDTSAIIDTPITLTGSTTVSGGQSLPETTVTVASTTGFPSTGVLFVDGNTVAYTGLSGGDTFTGCTGGTGTINNGDAVTGHQNTFGSGDVGKLFCIAQSSRYGTDHISSLCGTITEYLNSTQVYPSTINNSGSSATVQPLNYATDDCAGSNILQTALNKGGAIWFPGVSGCSTSLTLSPTISTRLIGYNLTSSSLGSDPPRGGGINFLSYLSGDALSLNVGGAQHVSAVVDVFDTMALQDQAGYSVAATPNYDAGCSTCNGVNIGNIERTEFLNNWIVNWPNAAVFLGTGAENVLFLHNAASDNGLYGLEVSGTSFLNAIGNTFVQSGTAQVYLNGGDSALTFQGNDIEFGTYGILENSSCQGCTISNNQILNVGTTSIVEAPTGSTATGASIINNRITGTVQLGNTSHVIYGAEVRGNTLGTLTLNAVSNTSIADNLCSGTTDCLTTAQSGTSGTATCTETANGTTLLTTCYLNGYANTGTAQTYSFPIPFATYPSVVESASGGASCGTYNPSATASTLTLPANASMTAETCEIVVTGQ